MSRCTSGQDFDGHGQDPPIENELSTAGVGDKIPQETADTTGISCQATCKTFRQSVVQCGFGELQSRAFLSESRVLDEKPLRGPDEHSQYRTIVGKLYSSPLNAQTFNSVSRNVPEE